MIHRTRRSFVVILPLLGAALSCAAPGPKPAPPPVSTTTASAAAPDPEPPHPGVDAGASLKSVRATNSLALKAPHIHVADLATAPGGDTFLVGSFAGKLSAGDVTIEHPPQDEQGFILRLDAAGVPRWGATLGDQAVAVATGPHDEAVVLVESHSDSGKIGSIALPRSPFVAMLAHDGLRWATGITGAQLGLVALGPDGSVFVYGDFQQTMKLGALSVRALVDPTGPPSSDVFVAKLDRNGKPVWLRRFGGQGNDSAGAIGVDDHGHIVITGAFNMTITLGKTVIEDTPPGAPESNTFVASLDRDGNVIWAHRLPAPLTYAVLPDADGGVLLGGASDPRPTGPLTVLAKLDERGTPVWTQQISCENGGPGIVRMERTRAGDVIAAGSCAGARLGPDAPPLVPSRSAAGFIERVRTDGTVVWATCLGGPGINALALRDGDAPLVAGAIETSVELDTGVLKNDGTGASFLAWLTPP